MTDTTITTTEGEQFWVLGARVSLLLDGSQSDGACCVFSEQLSPGFATPLHRQPGDDETFVVLRGSAEFWVEGETRTIAAGGAVHVARGTRHAFRVSDPAGAEVLTFGTPAGHEAFFRLAGDAAAPAEAEPPPAPLDMERMGAAAAAAGVELLGPPPFQD